MTPILVVNYGTPATDEYVGIASFSTQNSWDTGGGPIQECPPTPPRDTISSGGQDQKGTLHP